MSDYTTENFETIYALLMKSHEEWKRIERIRGVALELLDVLTEADNRINWEAHGFGNDFADRVERVIMDANGTS